ncbi:hypothetical protein GGTG_04684 [Gaeumannomyces tritici R3-111a-1]|uniref:Uncharacterized protein n=1 Tax=Gaeumannomyces tritici (strain R3-111a-1) TaxID=644352 RepID=J3NTT5_GAET3|nr:hypothetical protein GGTG_04684 [Gaeumannomyces tritici R3-111a-1]EJT79600.1 hypothetical protein GGTG_04684 [Gaeumannomyces tritici R3-111a-1]
MRKFASLPNLNGSLTVESAGAVLGRLASLVGKADSTVLAARRTDPPTRLAGRSSMSTPPGGKGAVYEVMDIPCEPRERVAFHTLTVLDASAAGGRGP